MDVEKISGAIGKIARRYVEAAKVKIDAIRKEGEASKKRYEAAETLLSILEKSKDGAANLRKPDQKAFEKAYKDLGKLLKEAIKGREKILKLVEDVTDPADKEEFDSAVYLVETNDPSRAVLAYEKAMDSLTHIKLAQASQTVGALYDVAQFTEMLVREATSAPKVEGFKYEPKENKQTKVDKLAKKIREATGLGKGTCEQIADAAVRGREVERLAMQKGWPVEDGEIVGPKGSMPLKDLSG